MWKRPVESGSGSGTTRSNRPGRVSAVSRAASRLVAPMTRIWCDAPKPSISASSWLSVWSCSSLPPAPSLRLEPSASISSMKRTHGARRAAASKTPRTRRAPRPTKTSTNSEPAHARKGTPAEPATALARSVLPVPGGPVSKTPRGRRAPSRAQRSGLWKKSTTSCSCALAAGMPPTSSKVTRAESFVGAAASGNSTWPPPRSEVRRKRSQPHTPR
mmetsp:Transcript_8962/g.26686  ORF Transcript_8962/g.26686 Transcript_8962/m.26686 type:complete len:216 (+) Transcript_8962:2902-3549(+)